MLTRALALLALLAAGCAAPATSTLAATAEAPEAVVETSAVRYEWGDQVERWCRYVGARPTTEADLGAVVEACAAQTSLAYDGCWLDVEAWTVVVIDRRPREGDVGPGYVASVQPAHGNPWHPSCAR